MQGRLCPPDDGKIQSFPVGGWRDEFPRAQEAGLQSIEWIYETGTDGHNPLRHDEGLAEMRELSARHDVGVGSVCADYYMSERLIGPTAERNEAASEHLDWLLARAGALGARYIVLPFVDASSLVDDAQVDALVTLLREKAPRADDLGVEVHLEVDLAPPRLVRLLERVDHPRVRANHDIGNSASLGFDPFDELTLLAPWLGSVHVKDRVRGGGTVDLGTGDADLPMSISMIRAQGFAGPLILQAARVEGLSEVALAIRNRALVERLLAGESQ